MQISAAQKDVGSNHAVSGLKFKVLRDFLQLGYAVLLSDVDIVTLQNPFLHLHRDSDIEAMSDGWNNDTAYGRPLPCLASPACWLCLPSMSSTKAKPVQALMLVVPY